MGLLNFNGGVDRRLNPRKAFLEIFNLQSGKSSMPIETMFGKFWVQPPFSEM